MDILQNSLRTFSQGGQAMLNDIRSLDLVNTINNIRNFDFGNIDWTNVNWGLVFLLSIVLGFVGFAVFAQITDPGYIPPPPQKTNAALGLGSEAKSTPGAPPIPPPTEIISLRVYPIKSCRGFEVDRTRLRRMGLTLDRNWMFMDKADNKFLTIRSDPSMTLIDTKITESSTKDEQMLEVSIHGTDAQISIPAFPSQDWLDKNTTLSTVEIWEKDTDAYEYSPDINKIFSEYFRKDVALVYKGPTQRMVAVNGRKELYGSDVAHHFADVMSLQIASEASIRDLNRRLKDNADPTVGPLTIERFRPNIVVRGRDDHPWEEDTWKRVRITSRMPNEEALYKIDLDVVARCARCQVPNVNPDTAEKHPKQPWDQLYVSCGVCPFTCKSCLLTRFVAA